MLKRSVYISIIVYLIALVSGSSSQLQNPGFVCYTGVSSLPSMPFGTGLTKPMKTLPLNSSTAQFRVLMVFVKFPDETSTSSTWPANGWPVYENALFAPEKEFGIDAYEDYLISDYFNKISNDQFDVIGDVYHVVLHNEYSRYSSLEEVETEVFYQLDNEYNINWELYDQWSWDTNTQQFVQVDDHYIDMAFIQYRMTDPFQIEWGGYGANRVNYTTSDLRFITNQGISITGTGVTGLDGDQLNLLSILGLFRHEYCHYTLGNHRPYSTIAGGDGTSDALGYELGFAPQDLITVGLGNVSTFTGTTNSFIIEDMTTTGDILKVPTTNSGEYFLVSNRQRVAGNGNYSWDCNMGGDTAMGIPFGQYADYSKGLYFYHVTYGDNFQAMVDLECADGLWNWEHLGTSTPDWHATQTLAVLGKTGIGYNDDNPTTPYFYDLNRLLSRDGMSVVSQTSYQYPAWGQKWFSTGKRHTCVNDVSCRKGTDRLFTNLEELWTAREHQGDRWDAWNNNYNEVFSPYSSPNTKDRSGNQTGIFIYLDTILGGEATIKVYQAAANTSEEDAILEATPPSKPMLYRPVDLFNCNGTYGFPRITWDNNLEPDMESTGLNGRFKRYKIYRAVSSYPDIAPSNYTYVGTYDDYTPGDTANFIDNDPYGGVTIYCGSEGGSEDSDYWRYKIVAVDSYNTESVPSDFVSTKGTWISAPEERPGDEELPTSYSLSQNYPNPFNPSTQIKYALPQNSFVTIKVYNAIGEEVARLVNNEFKSAGSYNVTFDGSNFGSGIYFYSIEAGQFKETKKMVLIK